MPHHGAEHTLASDRDSVLTAQDAAQWHLICELLSSGALAAARQDWAALTEYAPTSRAVFGGFLQQAARRPGTPLLLLACAFTLPRLFSLGVYGASLRSILAVSAALALLPSKSEAADVVRDTFAKTQSWRP